MDFNSAVNLIGSVGFPIVACVYLATTLNKTLQSVVEALQAMKQSDMELKEEIRRKFNGKQAAD